MSGPDATIWVAENWTSLTRKNKRDLAKQFGGSESTIQRWFWRALRRNEVGEIDESLIPDSIKEQYDGDSDEDTFEEVESDVECEKGTHKW